MSNRRRPGEGSIRQRADGCFEVRFSTGLDLATGKYRRISKTVQTSEEAVQLLTTLRNQNAASRLKPSAWTVENWYRHWLHTYAQDAVKRSTYVSYEAYLNNHFGPAIGKLKLKDITPSLLQNFYHEKVAGGLSQKTVMNMNLCLHKCLSQAEMEGFLLSNPAAKLNLRRGEKPEILVLTRAQQRLLMEKSRNCRYGVFIRLVLATGLRMGELLALQWKDIDLEQSTLYVRRTLNRLKSYKDEGPKTEIVFGTPKSQNSRRSIPLLPAVVADLKAWQKIQDADRLALGSGYAKTDMVVTNEAGGYIEQTVFRGYYTALLQDAGLPHFTFHALRHTFATRALEQGMDPKTLSAILGHYSVAFTLDTYAHVLNEHKHKAISLMANLYL